MRYNFDPDPSAAPQRNASCVTSRRTAGLTA